MQSVSKSGGPGDEISYGGGLISLLQIHPLIPPCWYSKTSCLHIRCWWHRSTRLSRPQRLQSSSGRHATQCSRFRHPNVGTTKIDSATCMKMTTPGPVRNSSKFSKTLQNFQLIFGVVPFLVWRNSLETPTALPGQVSLLPPTADALLGWSVAFATESPAVWRLEFLPDVGVQIADMFRMFQFFSNYCRWFCGRWACTVAKWQEHDFRLVKDTPDIPRLGSLCNLRIWWKFQDLLLFLVSCGVPFFLQVNPEAEDPPVSKGSPSAPWPASPHWPDQMKSNLQG